MFKLTTQTQVKLWALNSHLWSSADVLKHASYIAKAVRVLCALEYAMKHKQPLNKTVIKQILEEAERRG